MLINCAVVLLTAWTLQPAEAATAASVKLCGRKLSDIMSRVCYVYNSPSWGDPTVVEQPGMRRKRQAGIADQCCTFGCTWEQLNEYCAISSNSESALSELEAHMLETRGTEHKREAERQAAPETPPEVGRRSRGYGRRRGRCWCRRKRRTGRRRTLMGNMIRDQINNRPEPVVGTVSPVLTWGRTLNTDLPPMERNRYNYIAVYS
ncbi:insulin-like growth factor I isoform X1 [Cydia fagiglandana]|uniref:insulin-like growth factor I isoform X1 n=1 Tax=Cydia fagiglandana TaxID=1458189 RepID=UPI002FEE646C